MWNPIPKPNGRYWSYSRNSRALECLKRFYYEYEAGPEQCGMMLENPPNHLEGGRVAHETAEYTLLGRNVMDLLASDEQGPFFNYWQAGIRVAKWTLDQGFTPKRRKNGDLCVELDLIAPFGLETEIDDWRTGETRTTRLSLNNAMWNGFRFKIDLLAHHPEYGLSVIDFKFSDKMPSASTQPIDQDPQTDLYMEACHRIGLKPRSMFKIQACAKSEAIPVLNKNGSMSRANVNTTWATYRDALLENGLDPADYEADMRPKLDAKPWQVLVECHSNETSRRQTWTEMEQVALQVATNPGYRPRNRLTYTGSRCRKGATKRKNLCDFAGPCENFSMTGEEEFDERFYTIRKYR